jgi:SAM-dependent methyltransferase
MKTLYDEEYFERGEETGKSCYKNYRWIPELTLPFCKQIVEQLNIEEDESILDFGCAKGYMVKAFRLLNRDARGVDISEYAIESAPVEIKRFVCLTDENCTDLDGHYDWVIAKDTLEHISYNKIDNVLKRLRVICDKMFCIIPLGDGEKYIESDNNVDVTHFIKESLEWWNTKFENTGFVVEKSCYDMKGMKQRYDKRKKGHGFFILK